ncbi:DUF349 domain-containing protein [Dietzia cinnamea]|uniref:DUF349 domain-containing protein n=1 Tax=Dietzia cinnamea TaxID=321318 RepID=UPI0019595BBC|nr:DUF349 domain-containing protein [Dietzia cinnamea]MBM7229046.1 DUF349 domain-containing protein [Dietzia cinnamea]MCT1641294.1 DUF349 domain-containing protein [Dietzia cinnamea]MCT2062064.1 DUF349 domain-containing protein [Dietzia cinnamea]MCT2175745.1 DUF349 domain-containing protein [Dietzia cinnamea]MCT2237666.1 DUF349 domain-containing protein [Dietzia cinnamea]
MTEQSPTATGGANDGGATPTPGPRPGPRPGGPSPAALARKVAPRPTPAADPRVARGSDPSQWGRVDETGAVFVRTGDGERQVGSWQAGAPEEGLAHFGLRFDDLAAEVALLETRLESHPQDARKTRVSAEALAEQIPTAAAVGDLDSLAARLAAVIERSAEVEATARQRKDEQRAAAIARKEALASEAEEIGASSTQWKAAGDRLRDILEEWKTIRGIDRKTDDALWKRFSKAREAFNRRRGSHFAELDRNRASVKRIKEELVERAEALSGSTDWNDTATAFRKLMDEWKAAGRAPREADDALWKRFKAAQDSFFDARHAAAAERDAEFEANAEAKEALLAEFEGRIDPAADLAAARSALRDLQARWEEIGKVPRDKMGRLEGRIRALEKAVADAADTEWRRTDPEAKARAGQFWDRVRDFEEQAAKADAAGKVRDAESARAQAAQWREWAEAAEKAVDTR